MKTAKEIQSYIQEQLVLSVETKAEKRGEQEWTTGIPGAVLEGRLSAYQELLDWIDK